MWKKQIFYMPELLSVERKNHSRIIIILHMQSSSSSSCRPRRDRRFVYSNPISGKKFKFHYVPLKLPLKTRQQNIEGKSATEIDSTILVQCERFVCDAPSIYTNSTYSTHTHTLTVYIMCFMRFDFYLTS